MAGTTYTVRVGETVRDVVINSTGSFGNGSTNANWDAIATANNWTDWVPCLAPGSIVQIPSLAYVDQNVLRNRTTYPANNGSLVNYLSLIFNIWNLLLNNWILREDFWNDTGIWIDTDVWND